MTSKRELRRQIARRQEDSDYWYGMFRNEVRLNEEQAERLDGVADKNEELESTIRLQALLIRVLRRKLDAASVQS